MENRQRIIDRIFKAQGDDGFWKVLAKSDKYYPGYMHYVPNFKASLWTLILLADLGCKRNEPRIKKPLREIQNHFFDDNHKIFTLKEDHFPIPCLNGNMIYLDSYFNKTPDKKSLTALEFFYRFQRFDDGSYNTKTNTYCSNKSCYGKHSCYWGIVKLLKGISFIPKTFRTKDILYLRDKCIEFILLHKVCYKSRNTNIIMIKKMDLLTFPNMYKSDFLEILWLLKREKIKSEKLEPALKLLKSKQQESGYWQLERKVNSMVSSIGELGKPNEFVTDRANEVLKYYYN
ncbi:MAG: hypothetical protein D8M58_08560 [Calditrichaeota bacterium]|nr:MAG: hypothetical protein DWQ03_17930 [Calditrichota bacterium]MBL1205434.1 hypothetical protein [Calditrichota bacterium]